MGDWTAWLGREITARDTLDPALAARWCATMDRALPSDGAMTQGIHLCLCTPQAATAQLGEDGHPARDGGDTCFMPPVPQPRRMWASSTMRFLAPIRIGAQVERRSRIGAIEEKSGKSGSLVFVEVDHDTMADGTPTVRERQTLVYRDAAGPDAALGPPLPGPGSVDPSAWDAHRMIVPDPRLLFRFSALTFNTHRIHYDEPYAREVERYRGLVVHGPLMASLLLQLAADEFGENRLDSFGFRGLSPAIAGEELHLVMRKEGAGLDLAALAADGREVVRARASLT